MSVTHNVRRVREERRFSYAELSRQLADMGREIPPLGLRRIESGERRVDVDDLVALAMALGVTPITLLMQHTATQDTPVEVTGHAEPVPDVNLWKWLEARSPLCDDGESADGDWLAFILATWPSWMVRDINEAVQKGLDEQRARVALSLR